MSHEQNAENVSVSHQHNREENIRQAGSALRIQQQLC